MPDLLSASLTTWEQWYRSASVEQRVQLLDQAREQGLLYAHQLPPAEVGFDPASSATRIASILSGETALDSVTVESVEPVDAELDETQRQAVSRALSTPDLALLLGYPGTGKSRVVAEILRQASRRGCRALFVAPDFAAVDCVLERLADEPPLSIIRLPGDHEPPPSACIARRLLTTHLQSLHDQTLPAARRSFDDRRQQIERLQQIESHWGRLEQLCTEWNGCQTRYREALAARERLEADVAAEIDALDEWRTIVGQLNQQLATEESRLSDLQRECEQLAEQRRRLDCEREQLAPLLEAKQQQRWWTTAYWRATLSGGSQSNLEQLCSEGERLTEQFDQRSHERAELESHRQELLNQREQKRRELLDRQLRQRGAEIDARLIELETRREQLLQSWREAVHSCPGDLPAEPDENSIEKARAGSLDALKQAESEALQAKEWLTSLERSLPTLGVQLLTDARILAATTTSLPSEPLPGHALLEFDLVVIEDAHRVTESELLTIACRGRRVVLVGEASPDLPIAPPPRRTDRPRQIAPPLPFSRLWQTLHPDPRRLNARCRHSRDRLIVTLRSMTTEQHAWLQREPVFDRPEIELAIVSPPGQDAWIAEVSFPGSTSIAEAKQYLLGELQEPALHAVEHLPRWRESEAKVSCELSPPGEDEWSIALDEGVNERISRCTSEGEIVWQTQAIEFDRAMGWDRASSEHWIEDRLGLRDTGRTAVLRRNYRSRPALARFVSWLLYNGACDQGPEESDRSCAAVRFVSVPATARIEPQPFSEPQTYRNGRGIMPQAPRMRSGRGGAGLELDLTDPRRPDALPPELRPRLPARGLVNYPEAAAVVQTLEEMVADADLLQAVQSWQRQSTRCQVVECGESTPSFQRSAVVVVSGFVAQVELIRLLIQRSPTLQNAPFGIQVELPRDLAHCECLVCLLSLTRSHSLRAVPFCDHPRDLLLALTRAARQLIVFGDPGTMQRRSQWFGALDHLDESTGPLEQALLGQLLAYVPEQEAMVRAGRTLESSSV